MERTPPDRRRVLESYRDGVRAIGELAGRAEDWNVPTPCSDWQLIDLAGHLRCVGENFLEYLQDAPDSRLAKLFAREGATAVLIRQQARQNAAELAVLPPEPGPERIMAFGVSAGAYADLMPDMWDRTHLIYRGTKYTVGDHAGAACVEWHLHAWDMARALGTDYRPRRPRPAGVGVALGRPAPAAGLGRGVGGGAAPRRAGRRAGRSPTPPRAAAPPGRP
ncbi:maleylpyruvate isomerase N-terminal domain-containing protein, partial [Actinomadura sp. CNU-125]|uniref:maleylpyruvate isomerase N-terminal domain-containing protein n=1 Tax=Actinomadura sp. CNU-125 TaxID=1904961 RepID=UPI000ACA7A74